MDYGLELLKNLKLQRTTFIRTVDGKIITNHQLYNLLEDENFRLQVLIGKENKKLIN